jgi:hypothetical protein
VSDDPLIKTLWPRDERDVVDPIAKPAHYTFSSVEVRDAIAAWELSFVLGNVVKYVVRAGRKGDALEDLRKARNYLEYEIARRERK